MAKAIAKDRIQKGWAIFTPIGDLDPIEQYQKIDKWAKTQEIKHPWAYVEGSFKRIEGSKKHLR